MNTVFIYALNDPDTGRSRYGGKTNNPKRRFAAHMSPARLRPNTYKNCWIRALLAAGKAPVLEILDEVPEAEADFWEIEYIRVLRALFPDLTNGTDGGDGGGAANKGKKHSPESRANMSAAHRGIKHSPERCAAKSAYQTGRKHSPEVCEKMRATLPRGEKHYLFGKKHSLETLAKMRAVKLGKPILRETREKLSAAASAQWARYRGASK